MVSRRKEMQYFIYKAIPSASTAVDTVETDLGTQLTLKISQEREWSHFWCVCAITRLASQAFCHTPCAFCALRFRTLRLCAVCLLRCPRCNLLAMQPDSCGA